VAIIKFSLVVKANVQYFFVLIIREIEAQNLLWGIVGPARGLDSIFGPAAVF